MGSFSWMRAERGTKKANVSVGDGFKFLIPKEFGGGFIKDHYQDYGHLGEEDERGFSKYDMYELLAFWNRDMVKPYGELKYDGEFPQLKERDIYTDHNRSLGIDIGCYDKDIDKLKYPLKLVSLSYDGTYEDCQGYSYGDPNQGFYSTTWDEWDKTVKHSVEFFNKPVLEHNPI